MNVLQVNHNLTTTLTPQPLTYRMCTVLHHHSHSHGHSKSSRKELHQLERRKLIRRMLPEKEILAEKKETGPLTWLRGEN